MHGIVFMWYLGQYLLFISCVEICTCSWILTTGVYCMKPHQGHNISFLFIFLAIALSLWQNCFYPLLLTAIFISLVYLKYCLWKFWTCFFGLFHLHVSKDFSSINCLISIVTSKFILSEAISGLIFADHSFEIIIIKANNSSLLFDCRYMCWQTHGVSIIFWPI